MFLKHVVNIVVNTEDETQVTKTEVLKLNTVERFLFGLFFKQVPFAS